MVFNTKKIILIAIVFFISPIVSAAIGVTPAYYNIDFQPELKQVFVFNFLTHDSEMELEISLGGDLADYATLSTDYLKGGGTVAVSVELPENIDMPGVHMISVNAKQVVGEERGFAIIGNVIGPIRIRIPYPGQYAETTIKSTNANIGENIDLSLLIKNLGTEEIRTSSTIDIYEGQRKIETLDLGEDIIDSATNKEKLVSLNTGGYLPGNYRAVAIVQYGDDKLAEAETPFRLGHLYVDIINHSSSFERNKINRFVIETESQWNEQIDGVYAEIFVPIYNISFRTPSAFITPFGRAELTGFFDTSLIADDRFNANVTVKYADKSTSKIVSLELRKEVDYKFYAIVGGVALAFLLLAAVILYLQARIRRLKKG